jgi:molybdopterin-guanine dinucleotide biosynthesis protein A
VGDVGGLVLTGGSSRRFGVDKAMLLVEGERLADRALRVLGAVAGRVLEVGPAFASEDAVREDPPGGGPLAAVVAGWDALGRGTAQVDAVLVLAVDLPFVELPVLEWLARHDAPGSVVPVVDDVPQPLCARYSADALDIARDLLTRGERSMRALLDAVPVHAAPETEWTAVTDARAFADVDTPEDATALGVELPR